MHTLASLDLSQTTKTTNSKMASLHFLFCVFVFFLLHDCATVKGREIRSHVHSISLRSLTPSNNLCSSTFSGASPLRWHPFFWCCYRWFKDHFVYWIELHLPNFVYAFSTSKSSFKLSIWKEGLIYKINCPDSTWIIVVMLAVCGIFLQSKLQTLCSCFSSKFAIHL